MAAAYFALLVSGRRLLIHTTRVLPGEVHWVAGAGDVGQWGRLVLDCSYFTGRSVVHRAYAYAPDNAGGRDECRMTIPDTD